VKKGRHSKQCAGFPKEAAWKAHKQNSLSEIDLPALFIAPENRNLSQ
jgi:hypothetical protein